MEKTEQKNSLLLDDIARELGVSTSTVSRAISGKGRLSAKTRERVREYIELHNYQPNAAAQRLAKGQTGNIGVILPTDAFMHSNRFFQETLLGICRESARQNYDTLVTTVDGDDITYLKRLVARRSVDGIILMRSVLNDPSIQYLLDAGVDFVIIGSTENEAVRHVDICHAGACCELTLGLLSKTKQTIALILGDTNYIVNQNRLKGFESAVSLVGNRSHCRIYPGVFEQEELSAALEALLETDTDTLICGDDNLCLSALRMLETMDARHKIKRIASFYDNPILQSKNITAISVDDMELGAVAVKRLLKSIGQSSDDTDIPPLGYKVQFRR